jgi:hypothetical protein
MALLAAPTKDEGVSHTTRNHSLGELTVAGLEELDSNIGQQVTIEFRKKPESLSTALVEETFHGIFRDEKGIVYLVCGENVYLRSDIKFLIFSVDDRGCRADRERFRARGQEIALKHNVNLLPVTEADLDSSAQPLSVVPAILTIRTVFAARLSGSCLVPDPDPDVLP